MPDPTQQREERWTGEISIHQCPTCGAWDDEPFWCAANNDHPPAPKSPKRKSELRHYVPASRAEQAEEALRKCAELSGADLSGGFPTSPPLPEFAVREVEQLRKDYDDYTDLRRAEAAEARAGKLAATIEAALKEDQWCDDFEAVVQEAVVDFRSALSGGEE